MSNVDNSHETECKEYFVGYARRKVDTVGFFADAESTATWRGHNMSTFLKVRGKPWFDSWCKKCGKDVRVNLWPAPNETDVSGPAIAVNCDE